MTILADYEAFKVKIEDLEQRFKDADRRAILAEADSEAAQQIAADHKHRAEVAEAALMTIKGALASVDGTISAPVEIKAEAQADVSEYPVETPVRRRRAPTGKSAPLTIVGASEPVKQSRRLDPALFAELEAEAARAATAPVGKPMTVAEAESDYLKTMGITPAIAIRREAISALDSDAPKPIVIKYLISNAREYGLATFEQAYAILDQLVEDYPGLIVRRGGKYSATREIAPRDEHGHTLDHIGVTNTDWDELAAETLAAIKAEAPAREITADAFPFPMIDGPEFTVDQRIVVISINHEFQTVLELHETAESNGFAKGNQTVRNIMVRDIMTNPALAARIEQRDKANPDKDGITSLAWKFATPTNDEPKGDKPKVEAPANDGLAELRAAIEKATGSKVADNFKAETPEAPVTPYFENIEVDRPAYPDGFPTAYGDSESETGRTRMAWIDANLTPDQFTKNAQCQICERELQANNGIVRDHGHKRCDGWHDGPCLGSGKMPINVSFDALQDCIEDKVPANIRYHQRHIAMIENEDRVRDRITVRYEGSRDTYTQEVAFTPTTYAEHVAGRILNSVYSYKFGPMPPEDFYAYLAKERTWEKFKAGKLEAANKAIESLLVEIEERKATLAAWKPKAYLHWGRKR